MAKKKTPSKFYIVANDTEGFTHSTRFPSEKAAQNHIEKRGYMNTEYSVFYCERVSSAFTNAKLTWSEVGVK